MKKKRNFKKRVGAIGLVAILMIGMIGCGSNYATDEAMAYDAAYEEADSDFGYSNELKSTSAILEESTTAESNEETPRNEVGEMQDTQNQDVASNRKLIKYITMNLETLEYDTFTTELEALIEESGGYIEYLDQSNRSYYNYENAGRYASYTIRIPVSQLDIFVNYVGEMANVRSKNQQVTDVTLNYVDLESKKEMYEIEQENLMELLERADSVEDMITIESRLTEIRYQLQSMESQLRTYDNLVDYATISIYVDEVVRLEPNEEASVGERIRTGFNNSLQDTLDKIQEFGIRFIIALPTIILNLVILAIFVFVLILIIKTGIKKNKKKKMKYMAAMQNNKINNSIKTNDLSTEKEETKK